MAKTKQIMTMDYNGKHYVCIQHSADTTNPYKLYEKWYDKGWHRKKVEEYGDFDSILFYLMQLKHKRVFWDLTA